MYVFYFTLSSVSIKECQIFIDSKANQLKTSIKLISYIFLVSPTNKNQASVVISLYQLYHSCFVNINYRHGIIALLLSINFILDNTNVSLRQQFPKLRPILGIICIINKHHHIRLISSVKLASHVEILIFRCHS